MKVTKPLKGHPYHNKSDAELEYILKDAKEAAECFRGYDYKAECKYLDQINDVYTVLSYRAAIQYRNTYCN